ncbi:MAG TPA: ornithine carbamoyltransferase [Nitrososphaerales archaeon]|nr:ornithine carbamoyltransferase [Nitrososphaerales archaeon]
MRGKDLLTLAELTSSDVESILSLSARLKSQRETGLGSGALQGKTVALVFEKPSTRTRVSFQVAIGELGGHPISLSSNEMQLGRGETIEDTGRVLSRYVHCIMARVNNHADIVRLAKASRVPVINGLSDLYHPVQVLADLLTLVEHKGQLQKPKVAWVGDGDNVCNSWALGAALTGIEFVVATPKGYEPARDAIKDASALARSTGGTIKVVSDPAVAVSGADCVMTDTFVSMGFEGEGRKRRQAFLPKYQVNAKLMAKAKKEAIFMHCLPAHRGEEVSAEVLDGPASVVFDEAENRLHTTKALLCFLVLSKDEFSALKL